MQWACISFPQLALDDVLRRRSDAPAPLVLFEGAGSRARVYAANTAARHHGLSAGQSLTAARALYPRVNAVEYDAAAVERCHDFLAAWAYRYSSQVCRTFPQALLLEVRASFRLFGGWAALHAELRRDLVALGFEHRIAAAPNPHAALVLARARDGCAIEDEAHLLDALGMLPVQRSGLGAVCAESLQRMGLRRLHQLFVLPRAELGKRIGAQALLHLDHLRGAASTALDCYQPPDVFDQRIELPFNTVSHESLLFPLRRLLGDFSAFLAGRDSGAQRFTLAFEHERGVPTEISVGLLAPERDPELLFAIARARLDRTRLREPVCGLRLVSDELPPFTPARRDLFDTRPQRAVTWDALRERLRARLGEHAVHGLALHPEHRPERAWRVENPSRGTRHFRGVDESLPPRPTWLLARPIPLRERVARVLAGPERIESGWWDGADMRRDYYVVETASHQRAWAFRPAGEGGPFMLQGWFA
ncbi:MAG: DNA polymerase Y family protein [Xanthomonadales bacterium]|nr:DNA polymerase Y family protein [Xanthomonadales bacterium]ODU92624.1 MAG: DNA repair nucleotidyltransferase [Rhodanobacter sp. SCN 66-43]OJY85433.1 MAG: DNA repair nucleotidyltransferase [Xanthomonadales bacterium 66-474]